MNARQIMTAVWIACLGSTAGCGGDENAESGGTRTGTLLQRWSIEGKQDASKCAQYKAERMRIVLYDESGGTVSATELAPCKDFQKKVTLRTQRYTGEAILVNASGDPVSQAQSLPAFEIGTATTYPAQIDFPASAMQP
jgi:hypothetical protein